MDYGHAESDRRLAELERRIEKEYKQAYKEVKAKTDKFFEKFRDKDKKLSQKVKQGEINKSDYIEWRRKAMIRGNALINLEKTLAQDLVNADRIAGQMISGHKVDVYALNRNYGEYEIENALNIDLGFSIYDHKSVEKLIKDQPALLPTQLDEARDLKWNRQKVSSAITQGILQGESIPNISKRLRKVVGMDKTASIRNARTATTGAENAGRVDSYEEAESRGVELEKKWVATLDQRTRSEHRQLDGQTCPIHDKFKVDGEEIEYPGDPQAAGYLVYNCRCTIVAEVKGIEYKDVRRNRLPEGMTYEEWKGKREKESEKDLAKKELHTRHRDEYHWMQENTRNITYRQVNNLDTPLSDEEIIEKISGGDMTRGSCASLSLSYASNKMGLDVTDFRGGNSQDLYCCSDVIRRMFDISDAQVNTYVVTKEAKGTADILNNLEIGKEYILAAGKHMTIVRNTKEGTQYLELQSNAKSGWKNFKDENRTEIETLVSRFGCKKTTDKQLRMLKTADGKYEKVNGKTITIVDIDTMNPTEEFKEMMGYINTATDKQKKGVKGGTK